MDNPYEWANDMRGPDWEGDLSRYHVVVATDERDWIVVWDQENNVELFRGHESDLEWQRLLSALGFSFIDFGSPHYSSLRGPVSQEEMIAEAEYAQVREPNQTTYSYWERRKLGETP